MQQQGCCWVRPGSACIFLAEGAGLVLHAPGQWDVVEAFTGAAREAVFAGEGRGQALFFTD